MRIKILRIVFLLGLIVTYSINNAFVSFCLLNNKKTNIVYADESTNTSLNWHFVANGRRRTTTMQFVGNKVIGYSSSGGYSEFYLQLRIAVRGVDGKFRWSQKLTNQSQQTLGNFQEQDTIIITPIVMNSSAVTYDISGQPIPGLITNDLALHPNLTMKFRNGKVTKADGTGQAQVLYNVNVINPDPTTNPDFTVLIPKEYKLTDLQELSVGNIALKDANDISKNYDGEQTVKVKVASAHKFKFDNGGEYRLVDGLNMNIPEEITLNKTTNSFIVNAQLTKKGRKLPSVDTLTFTYSTNL